MTIEPVKVDDKRSVYLYWYPETNVLKIDLGTNQPGGGYTPDDFEKIKVRKTPKIKLPEILEGFIKRNHLEGDIATQIYSRLQGLKTT